MIKISKRLQAIKPSATLAMNAKAREMRAQGVDVISFAAGEPDFDTPANIREAGKRAIDEGLTRYTPSSGMPELKEAIAAKLERDNRLEYSADEITVSCGAKHAIYNALQAAIDPGDEVIVPAPYWVSYPDQVALAGGTTVTLPTYATTGFRITPEQLDKAIGGKTRAIILNYPSNPTGSTYSAEELKALGELLAEKGILIISDEIYEKLLFNGGTHVSIAAAHPPCRENTVVVGGVSKSYAMTGWRMGFAAGPAEIISRMSMLAGQQISGIPGFVQKACLEALGGPQEEVARMRDEFKRRRDLMIERLATIEGVRCHVPDGTFYLFPHVDEHLGKSSGGRQIETSLDLADYLLEVAHIATVAGEPFGAPGHLRLSFATSTENIEEGTARLAEALGGLA